MIGEFLFSRVDPNDLMDIYIWSKGKNIQAAKDLAISRLAALKPDDVTVELVEQNEQLCLFIDVICHDISMTIKFKIDQDLIFDNLRSTKS